MLFARFTSPNNLFEFETLRSEMFTLACFCVSTGVVVVCCGGNVLPLIAYYMVNVIFVLALAARSLWTRYTTACDKLKVLQHENLEIAKLKIQLRTTKQRLFNATQALEAIKQELVCPFNQDLPTDPVITATGFVCSDYALDRYARVSGYYKCPITRTHLDARVFVHSTKLSNICDEIRMWEDATFVAGRVD